MAAVDIRVLSDAGEAAKEAAAIAGGALAAAADVAEGPVFLALSGGITPRGMYERLAVGGMPGVPWRRVHVLWVDERCVPPTDLRSNYRMARETGLLDLPLAGVHRMLGELGPGEGARRYDDELHTLFPDAVFPGLDLVVLGVGADGHTASLVPGAPALEESKRWVAAVESYQGTSRLTLSLPVLAWAKHLLFVVSGEAKADIVGRLLKPHMEAQSPGDRDAPTGAGPGSGPAEPHVLPVSALLEAVARRAEGKQGVETAAPRITWVIDEQAASALRLHDTPGDGSGKGP